MAKWLSNILNQRTLFRKLTAVFNRKRKIYSQQRFFISLIVKLLTTMKLIKTYLHKKLNNKHAHILKLISLPDRFYYYNYNR